MVTRPVLPRPPDFLSGLVSADSGSVFVISENVNPLWKRRPGDVGRYWTIGIALDSLEEVDTTSLGERDVGLLPVRPASHVTAHAPDLPELAAGAHLLDFHLEERLDGPPDLDLVRLRVNAEDHLATELVDEGTLLRDDRTANDVRRLHASSPTRRAASCSSAARVTTRCEYRSTSYTLSPPSTSTWTRARFRAARWTVSSAAASTIRTSPPPNPRPSSSSCMRFVLGSERLRLSITRSRPSAWRAARAARSAARRALFGRR